MAAFSSANRVEALSRYLAWIAVVATLNWVPMLVVAAVRCCERSQRTRSLVVLALWLHQGRSSVRVERDALPQLRRYSSKSIVSFKRWGPTALSAMCCMIAAASSAPSPQHWGLPACGISRARHTQGSCNVLRGERLKAGERLVASNDIETRDKPDMTHVLAWQTGYEMFDNEELSQAAEEMNRYSTAKLAVDPSVAGLKVSGVYRVGDNAAFAHSLTKLLPVTVRQIGDTLVLTADPDQ